MDIETTSAPVPDPRLDAVILSCGTGDWCKVAVLIARATDAARAQSIEANAQLIAAHIYALVADHRLDAQGNVRRWRAGEVRSIKAA